MRYEIPTGSPVTRVLNRGEVWKFEHLLSYLPESIKVWSERGRWSVGLARRHLRSTAKCRWTCGTHCSARIW